MNKNIGRRTQLNLRLNHWRVFVVYVFLALAISLFFFQVLRGEHYASLSTQNKIRVIRTSSPRGEITDVHGAPLAVSVRTFDIVGYPPDLRQAGALEEVAALLKRQGIPATAEGLDESIRKQYWAPYRPVTVASNLTLGQVATLVSDPAFPKFLFPTPVFRRVYPAGSLAAHVVGYVGEVTREEMESHSDGNYKAGDLIGKTGIELVHETTLRGIAAEEAVEVDALGRRRKRLSSTLPVKGRDLRLTLDLGAQREAQQLLGERKGVILAMDVRDGAVKVLYSAPSYDPNPLTWGVSSAEWARLLKDPDRPMMNRAISGAYPPGSTFKAVPALAALVENVVTPKTTVYCPGQFKLGNRVFRCWKRSGHGTVNLVTALKDSCDVYFYQVGLWLGADRLLDWSKKMGVGQLTGIDLPGESRGNLAGREWKKKRFSESWFQGDTVNYSIGQGFLLMTPLQLARIYAAFANGGTLVVPHLTAEEHPAGIDLHLPPDALGWVRKGMEEVVRSGTGRASGVFGVSVTGKTGTAQNPHGEDHAWFVGYAPSDKPRYVAVALVEGGGHGSSAAAPLVGQVLAYLVGVER
ncbi:MAG: penicillin-binding protein 2 [Synergistaceae bacterium]|nr:penicillin-binding protein 2 [Synergistaceae bacterium]